MKTFKKPEIQTSIDTEKFKSMLGEYDLLNW